ncbi:hypothetical protein P43SY_000011 [Pythium insidiosum]|uniref:Uncharacterized protein n=1 Tax=Pythium insidiosum TaxID=114742 RepID=A0AAD5LUM3_PYTIN|nr:hypothetical protein P43SY_000011 [Pythium insidiosum]
MVRLVSVAALSAAAAVPLAAAHTNMMDPQPNWPANFYNGNSPYGRIDGDKFQSSVPNWQGANRINDVLKSTGSATLRDFIYKNIVTEKDKECGNSLLTGPKRTLGNAIDFPWGHPGPCEAWCDDNKIFFNENCQGNNVGKIPVDKAKCNNAKRVQVFYVGTHVPNWEVYGNCAPLEGSGAGPAPAPGPAPGPTPGPAPGPTPKPNPAPKPTKNKCNRRLRKDYDY